MSHLLLLLLPALSSETEPPLKPFLDLAQVLERGAAEWLEGSEAEKAWPDWRSTAPGSLRETLKEQKVASARTFGFEFEVSLLQGERTVARAEFLIVFLKGKVSIGEVRTRSVDRGPYGAAVKGLKDKSGLIGKSAEALVQQLRKADGPDGLPITNPDDVAEIVPAKKVAERAREDIAEAKVKLAGVIERFKKAEYDSVRVKMDDQVYLAYDRDGKVLGGIRGDFDTNEDGTVEYQFERFLPFPKE